jgi:hypothetical protein
VSRPARSLSTLLAVLLLQSAAASAPGAPPAPPAREGGAEQLETEAEAGARGWFRIDSDQNGLQFWVGATHPLGGPVGLASNIYLLGTFAELDAGIELAFGNLTLTPMVGIGIEWREQRVDGVAFPQLYTTYDGGWVYFESWIEGYLQSVVRDGGSDTFYTRDFLLFYPHPVIGFGPHFELTLSEGKDVASLQVGGAVMLSYGEEHTLLLALGYETVEAAREVRSEPDAPGTVTVTKRDGIVGRFTYIHAW